jgi:lysozyme family protein
MQDNFVPSLGFVFRWECVFEKGHYRDMAYVVTENVPGDEGGLTKFGVDATDHPGVDIANLTQAQATQIYHDGEWTRCLCDSLPLGVDTCVFDEAVNEGCEVAGLHLQGAIAANGYAIAMDGIIGADTVAKSLVICARSRWLLINPILAMRRAHYHAIVAKRPGDAGFLQGWLDRVNDLENFLKGGGQS